MINRDDVLHTLECDPNEYPYLLDEQFPHVLKKVVMLWNTPDADTYIADLLQPNGRGGGRLDRGGFPDAAWEEILRLKILNSKRRAH